MSGGPWVEEEFAIHPSVRVLRATWHPNSDGHLVVLLSDGTLHVFDAAVGEVQQAFRQGSHPPRESLSG
jgi:nuclear pore complex protein Nup88